MLCPSTCSDNAGEDTPPPRTYLHKMPSNMILVIGNDPNKVEVTDLGDVVYYKQQKIYSEAQYARSADLKRAEKSGRITVLQKYGDVDGDLILPSSSGVQRAKPQDTSKIDLVLEKMAALELSLKSAPTQGTSDQDALLERIGKIEERLSGISGDSCNEGVLEAVRQLAEKVESSTKDTSILDRLESILKGATDSKSSSRLEPTRPEDVYVPNVSVEDGNTHIKLDVRTVEGASDIDDSLKALKDLKSQNL